MRSQHCYSIEDDDDAKFLLAYIRKIYKVEALAINKTVVDRQEPDISVKNIWVV